ncbi:hypothetical protein [Streptomyces sp. NPDC086147]|uniref:hypothetical protein n=1 Tax=Streptomyces sp. NPDC086147 TaxID=3155295 RepID=UPI00344D2144
MRTAARAVSTALAVALLTGLVGQGSATGAERPAALDLRTSELVRRGSANPAPPPALRTELDRISDERDRQLVED